MVRLTFDNVVDKIIEFESIVLSIEDEGLEIDLVSNEATCFDVICLILSYKAYDSEIVEIEKKNIRDIRVHYQIRLEKDVNIAEISCYIDS